MAQVLVQAPTNGSHEYALTTFGGGCDVEVPIDFTGFTDDPQRVVDYSAGLHADGSTPLAEALQRGQHLALDEASSEDILLVLLSDGEETCSGDPVG
ncbi:MAG: VWA domain-containing protein, partial [Gemmatimonadetes bacterium]|nr:VWA domain-containing protein [Gemmatimonadota bacterium]